MATVWIKCGIGAGGLLLWRDRGGGVGRRRGVGAGGREGPLCGAAGGGEELHVALGAVGLQSEPTPVVVEEERAGEGVGVALQAESQLVAQTVFGCHEGFAVVVEGLFEPIGYLLHAVAAVELFGKTIYDVGAVVKRAVGIGCVIGLALGKGWAMASLLHVGGGAAVGQQLDCIAAQLVEHCCGDKPGLGAAVVEGVGAERGAPKFAELALQLVGGTEGVACGFLGAVGCCGGLAAIGIGQGEAEARRGVGQGEADGDGAFGGGALQLA